MKKIIYLLTLIWVFSAAAVHAQEAAMKPRSLFTAGNYLYEQREYQEAIKKYEDLVKRGFISPEIFYNLGNSYFKADDLGMAILNYERALIQAPRDKDIKMNLALAKGQITDEIKAPSGIFIQKFIADVHDSFTVSEHIYFSLAVLVMFTVLSAIAIYNVDIRKKLIPFIVLLLFILFSAGISCAVKINSDMHIKKVVVLSQSTDARSGPGGHYIVQFKLHEGSQARIIKSADQWVEIEAPGKLRGWIKKDDVEVIWPPLS